MTWVKLSDDFTDSPKLAKVTPELRAFAVELYVAGLCYASRMLTDGYLPPTQIRRLVDFMANDHDPYDVAEELVRVGMWERADGSAYLVHDFLSYNPSREKVERQRDEWRERQQRSRDASRRDTQCDSTSDAQCDSTSPVPVPDKDSHPPLLTPAGGDIEQLREASGMRLTADEATSLVAKYGRGRVEIAIRQVIADTRVIRNMYKLVTYRLEHGAGIEVPRKSNRPSCPRCAGYGMVYNPATDTEDVTCPDCAGTGDGQPNSALAVVEPEVSDDR